MGGLAGPRVLIVDDHDGFRAVARTLLNEGFVVVGEAADGVEAVRATERLSPAMVLLDVHLPGEDGFAVTDRLAALAEPPAVVLISSRLIADLHQRVRDSAAVGFLAKHELTGAGLRAMVERREPCHRDSLLPGAVLLLAAFIAWRSSRRYAALLGVAGAGNHQIRWGLPPNSLS